MMKRIVFVIILSMLVASAVQAQTFIERTQFEISTATGLKNHDIRPVDFSFKCHVDIIPILYLFITLEDNLSLLKDSGSGTYVNGASGGGGIGVKLLNRLKGIHALDLRAKSLDSFGKPDWDRTTYDVALAWYIKDAKFSPVAELGYRFIDSHTNGFKNYGNAYLSFGIRF